MTARPTGQPLRQLQDRNGLPLSSTSVAAVERYVEGVDRLLSADAGAIDCLQRAIDADPGFALAHAALAIAQRQRGAVPLAKASANRASSLVGPGSTLTVREWHHVEAVAALVGGETGRALKLIGEHLEEYPQDALLLHQALLLTMFEGGSANGEDPRAQRLAFFEHLAAHYGDDWWYLAVHSLALSEMGHPHRARTLVERSLALHPRNGLAAHSFAHVCYETGQDEAGASFLSRWLPHDDPRAGYHTHNAWHLACFELARGRARRAFEVYEAAVSPGPERPGQAVLLAADAAAFLWRCWLCGYPPATLPWGAAHEYVTATPPPAAARPLWDAHAAVIYAGAGDGEALHRLRERLRQADSASYPQARRVVLPLAEALAAFAEGAYEASIDFLEPVIPALVQLGGSNERQDIFEDTLIEAYLRTGHCGAAEVRLRQRLARRPSARDAFCLGRALTAAGRVKDAAAALHLAHDGWHLADADSPELSALERLWEELYSGQPL